MSLLDLSNVIKLQTFPHKELRMLEIYLTDLQAYNEGHLVGKWVELPLTPFELSQAISEVLTEGEIYSGSDGHEEYFITDYSWQDIEFFSTIDEYENLYELNKSLQAIEEVEESKHKAIAFLLAEGLATSVEDAIGKAEDVRIYENQTMGDVAYELMQDCYSADALPSIISNHIDYEGIARDLEIDGNYFEVGADIYEYVG